MANDQSIETLKGIGEKTAKLFEKVGIRTIDDLLHYYPKGYDTYGEPKAIGELSEDETGAVEGFLKSGATGVHINGLSIVQATDQRHDRETAPCLVSYAVPEKYAPSGQSLYFPRTCDPEEERSHNGTAPDV